MRLRYCRRSNPHSLRVAIRAFLPVNIISISLACTAGFATDSRNVGSVNLAYGEGVEWYYFNAWLTYPAIAMCRACTFWVKLMRVMGKCQCCVKFPQVLYILYISTISQLNIMRSEFQDRQKSVSLGLKTRLESATKLKLLYKTPWFAKPRSTSKRCGYWRTSLKVLDKLDVLSVFSGNVQRSVRSYRSHVAAMVWVTFIV